ncbi:MAG: DUF4856 domain-containing protein [Bacteroidota bacterium]
MKNKLTLAALLLAGVAFVSSCKKEDKTNVVTPDPILPYTVPVTYNFAEANYASSTARVKMAAELNTYLGTANNAVITLEKANNMFNNTNAPFTDATLNASGVSLAAKTADPTVFTGYFTEQVANSTKNTIAASKGVAGILTSGTTKRLVGGNGLEYNQAVAKGMMGALFFKEAVALLAAAQTADNKTKTNGTTQMQRLWDEAFGYLGVPKDYDTLKTYTSADLDRPLIWGGYLAERGKPINAGATIFKAFLKGRAAIAGNDYAVVKAQAKIIVDKWEQLDAAAALEYSTIPTRSTSVGNKATQMHALSEGFGFIYSLKYRPATSKLSATDYATLKSIFETNFYDLIDEANFTKLNQAQTILKTTYGLNY